MSFNRENVTFQNAAGKWRRVFYRSYVTGPDPEWDVDYDFDSFDWVGPLTATEAAANASWDGANPGSEWILKWSPENVGKITELEAAIAAAAAARRPGDWV